METTPNNAYELMGQSSASKYVVFNTLVRRLDALLSLACLRVLDRNLTAPPGSPDDGALYIVASTATGLWTGQENKIAYYNATGWEFFTASSGWVCYVVDEAVFLKFDGSVWVSFHNVLQNISLLGINATADVTNKLAIASAASLFNHNGSSHEQKINKATTGDKASQQYQVGFSTRAEIGLIGNNKFSFKVSPDGTAFFTALELDNTNGVISCPNGQFNGTFVLADDTAITITPPASMLKSGMFMLHAYDPAGIAPQLIESAVMWFDVGTTANTRTVNAGTETNITTGTLTGTTGTDVKLTVAAHSDGLIYVENRRGGSRNFRYVFIG